MKKTNRAPTHRGPDNWTHDVTQSNKRALASIAARRHKAPAPKWGRRSA